MKRWQEPKRMCAGQYQWHGFEIHRPEGDYVYWNVATIDGFWFGESGYLESHPSDPFNWSPLKDEDGNYIVVLEDINREGL